MGAMDVYAGGDALPSDLAIVLGLFLAFSVLVGLLHMLAFVLPRPRAWPLVIGSIVFWPLLLQGRPWAAMGAVMLGLISFQVLTALQERKQRASSVRDTN